MATGGEHAGVAELVLPRGRDQPGEAAHQREGVQLDRALSGAGRAFPALRTYSDDPEQPQKALRAHEQTQPGWAPLRADLATLAIAYGKQKELLTD